MTRSTIAICLVLGMGGCDLFDDSPPPPTTAAPLAPSPVAPAIPGGLRILEPSFSTTSNGHVAITSSYGNIEYDWVAPDASASFVVQAMPGSTVTIDGAPVTLDATGKGTYRIELLPILLSATTEAVTGQGIATGTTKNLAVTITNPANPGAAPTVGSITVDYSRYLKDGVRQLFSSVAAGRPLAGAQPREGGRKSVLYLPHFSTQAPEHFGLAGTISQVDWVAIAKEVPQGVAGECGPFDNGRKYPRQNVDIEVKIYAVATGAEVASQMFAAGEESCPTFAFITEGEPVKVYVDERRIRSWIESRMR